MGRGPRGTLLVLIGLDIIGTAMAAYMLEATGLLAAMAIALLGWLAHLTFDHAPGPSAGNTLVQRGAE
jgi:hypothetical protein